MSIAIIHDLLQCKWTSHHANALGAQDELISQQPEYSRLGLTPEARQSAYRELFNAHLDPQTLTEIRNGLNGELVTGTGRFKAEVEAMLGRKTQMGKRGRPRKSTDAYKEGEGKHEQLSIEGGG